MNRLLAITLVCVALAGCGSESPPTDSPQLTSASSFPTTLDTAAPSTLPTQGATTWPTVAPRSVLVAYSVCDRLDPEDPQSCAGKGHVWVMNGDGTGAHALLPADPETEWLRGWLPDGRLHWFSTWWQESVISDLSGSDFSWPAEPACPAATPNCSIDFSLLVFSPDGSRLAYPTWEPCAAATADPCGRQDGTITVLDIATGRATRLEATRIPGPFRCCDGYYRPSWSPDGTRLLFVMPPGTINIIDADGTNFRQLGHPGETGSAPRWSPDGSTIASGTCGVQPMLYLIEPDGQNARTVETSGCEFEWTRDGRIVFRDQDAGRFEPNRTWIMDADGGNLERLDDSVLALTQAGCIVCPLLDADRLVTVGFWQPVSGNQP